MSQAAIFIGKVEQNRLQLDAHQKAAMATWIRLNDSKWFELRLSVRRRKRSLPQNAYYWSQVVGLLAEFCGYTPEEMHDALKERFLRDHANEVHGIPKIRSTTELNTQEFSDYCEQCRQLAAELGVVIPDPE